MKKPYYLTLFFLGIATLFGSQCFSQTTSPDSVPTSYANAAKIYNSALGIQSPLYTGPEYNYYNPAIKGNAYYLESNQFTNGAVFYDGVLYANVPLLYDIYADKLVSQLYDHFSKYLFIKDRVQSFDIDSHHFVHIVVDSTAAKKPEIKSGYFDEIYNGKTEVLVKRAKNIQTTLADVNGAASSFSPTTAYFIKHGDAYYKISGGGDMLNVLKDRKQDLQQYIKSNKIRFGSAVIEESMVKVATYYDHLAN